MIALLILQLISAQSAPFLDVFSSLRGNNLTTGLRAYYKFDEATGNLIDSGPSLLHIPVIGSPLVAAGKLNNARGITTGGSQGFIRGHNAAYAIFSPGFTVAFWVKFTGGLEQYKIYTLMGKGNLATGSTDWAIEIFDTGEFGNLFFTFPITYALSNGQPGGTSGITLQTPSGSFTLNTWYCVVGKHIIHPNGADEAWLYVRKAGGAWTEDYDNSDFEFGPYVSNTTMSIGGWSSSFSTIDVANPAPNGSIFDELAFWSRGLTDCERDQFYNAGLGKLLSLYDTLPCQ